MRTDLVVLYFTDHSSALIRSDGNTYTPAGAPEATAQRKQAGLEAQGRDMRGAITSAAITTDDLRAGRYRGALVYEYLVDWLYPHLGDIATNVYEIVSTEHDREGWEAEIDGLGRHLANEVGLVYTKQCRHKLGDSGCTVDLESLGSYGIGVASLDADEPRRIFRVSSFPLAALGTGYFDLGELRWIQGANEDLEVEVRTFTFISGSTVEFELHLPMPFDISATFPGDQFNVFPGCNKLSGAVGATGHCKNKFSNMVNFGGQPFIPGPDRALWTPPG